MISLAITCAVNISYGAKWAWQEVQAEITPTGDLKWKPKPFQYSPGNSIRYIDYESGNDNNNGTSKQQAWKHHPWDPAATGNAKNASGVHTYVFKRGVVYRGKCIADESGAANNPIRLTSDPNWGNGEALFYGSEKVTGTWTKGAHANMADDSNIWHIDLPFAPRRLWMVEGEEITEINIARTPNWQVTDPDDVMGNWFKFQGAGTRVEDGKEIVRARDAVNLRQSADYYKDAIIYCEWEPVMSMPFPTRVIDFDESSGVIKFNDPAWPGCHVHGHAHYYLEDKPHYLDHQAEFWFDKTGEGGRLYVWLPGNKNPNQVHLEAAKRLSLITLDNQSNYVPKGSNASECKLKWDQIVE